MEQREKLIELLCEFRAGNAVIVADRDEAQHIADHLLANGVVVLPCRCCDCEHCDIGQNDIEQWCICQMKRIDVDPTDFCPYAKRKGGDE